MAGFGGRQGPSRCIGLDVGTSSVKGVRLHRAVGGIEIAQAEKVELPSEAQPAQRSAAVRQVLEKLSYRDLPAVVSVGGAGTILRRISLPKMTPQELRSAFSFEAERHIPFKMEEVFFDFSILTERPGGQMDVLLVAARRELVNDLLGLLSLCEVTPLAVDLEMVALTNAWEGASSPPESGVTALLHIGSRGTVLDFIRDSQLEFAREINVGGSAFTQAVASTLRLGLPEAERLKCRPEGRAAEVRAAMQPAWEEWLSQCRVSFDFYENQFGQRVDRLVLSGGAARCPEFKEWVQEASGLPVKVWDPMSKDPSFTIAVGLALRGLAK